MEPRPSFIRIDDENLSDLRERLGRARWPEKVVGFAYRPGRISGVHRGSA